jgi:hypothetical protein
MPQREEIGMAVAPAAGSGKSYTRETSRPGPTCARDITHPRDLGVRYGIPTRASQFRGVGMVKMLTRIMNNTLLMPT